MAYTNEQRLSIGKQIFEGEIDVQTAAETYGFTDRTARNYLRLYKESINSPIKKRGYKPRTKETESASLGLEEMHSMTKEELINELIMARITEARLKKGYEVKGDGSVILYDKKNIK